MNIAIILAAGNGNRMNSSLPKQYLQLENITILEKSLKIFSSHPSIDKVLLVLNCEHLEIYNSLQISDDKLLPICFGGDTRQESVRLGLLALESLNPRSVLIHDAARPFVSHELIDLHIDALRISDAVDTAMDVVDTVRNKKNFNTLNRDELYLVQTPQSFKYDVILDLHKNASYQGYTDDIAIAKDAGLQIRAVSGSSKNIKITMPEDLMCMKKVVNKIGQGIDFHKIEKANASEIPLCGVLIPCEYKVIAHSDGDVAIHAIMDAILGALGLGDIGELFSPTDEKWRGADSKEMLAIVLDVMKKQGYDIVNLDINIMCEYPRIAPYREMMRQCIAQICKINPGCVNIKATTTEKMGFIGRKEGFAAMSVVGLCEIF